LVIREVAVTSLASAFRGDLRRSGVTQVAAQRFEEEEEEEEEESEEDEEESEVSLLELSGACV
jgi:ribosomal protein L12E/L44/L45/RPP1/RPP2